ncbi:MAG: hypothetical protein AAFZ87_13025, partial [Planctomycetota bacterium]
MLHSTLLLLALSAPVQEQTMTPELLWELDRVGSTAVSSDGVLAAYAVRDYDLSQNSGRSTVHVVDIATGESRVLLDGWKSAGALQFAPTPFGERLMLAGRPDVEGARTQLYAVNVEDGGVRQVTDLEDGVSNVTSVDEALVSWVSERGQGGSSTLTFQVEDSLDAEDFGTGKSFVGGTETATINGSWSDGQTITNVVDLADQLNALIAAQGPLNAGDTINVQITGAGTTRYIEQASAVIAISGESNG